ncbi:MAG: diaminopimelate decarboxylase [Opitutales bacterium]|nr:diaminopimelate decarboxylase [Opitutales bacterium]
MDRANTWWQRSDLRYVDGTLHLSYLDLTQICSVDSTPQYVYSGERILSNLARLDRTLSQHEIDHRIFYAMKSNRFPDILRLLKHSEQCGIDACSPGEVERALECGFDPSEISFTATALSERDLDYISSLPELTINLDSLSALRRWGQRCPGTGVGLRINPETSIGYRDNEQLQYASEEETKFGIYASQWEEALEIADSFGLKINGIHCHAGCGFTDLSRLPEVLKRVLNFAEQVSDLAYVNLGGGLGIPLDSVDASLDLDAWAQLIKPFHDAVNCPIYFEPGDYIVKDSGVLLATVTMVERKKETLFVGLDTGFNAHMEPAFYHLPLEPIPLIEPSIPGSSWERVTLSGNINEALDIFYRDIPLPPIREGEQLALINAGGYGASMASQHCLRSIPTERLISSP